MSVLCVFHSNIFNVLLILKFVCLVSFVPKNHILLMRTTQQLKNHYEVEKELADQLRKSTREERKELYERMYDQLFERVPDHPRLTTRADPEMTHIKNKNKLLMVQEQLKRNTIFAEFAPGDCEFCFFIADRVRKVYAMDISDQTDRQRIRPQNFELIVYDGYRLDMPENSIDLLFSDQFIEHLHPDDVQYHYDLTHRLLAPGGKYIFRYPHLYRGPSDISRFFSDVPMGFHLNESTFTATVQQLKKAGYKKIQCYWFSLNLRIPISYRFFHAIESLLEKVKPRFRRPISKLLLPTVHIEATK